MRRMAPMIAALLALAGASTLLASRAQTTFKSRVEAVRLDVSVTRGGQPVSGLSAADFAVTDNNVPQQVEVEVDSLPLSVFLVLDTSGSVAGEKLSHLVNAASALVTALHSGDRAALITFSEDVSVRVPLTADVRAAHQRPELPRRSWSDGGSRRGLRRAAAPAGGRLASRRPRVQRRA